MKRRISRSGLSPVGAHSSCRGDGDPHAPRRRPARLQQSGRRRHRVLQSLRRVRKNEAVRREAAVLQPVPLGGLLRCRVPAGGRGLHSPTFQLNLSAFYGIRGARRDCVARIKGVLGGVQGV